MDDQFLFAYGILRPKWRESVLEEGWATMHMPDCKTWGVMNAYPESYPVVQFESTPRHEVTGCLLRIVNTDHRDYIRMCQVEIGAGYVPVMVTVFHELVDTDIKAMAWHWPHDVEGLVEIPSGDWIEYITRADKGDSDDG